jgi:hypothetical protein
MMNAKTEAVTAKKKAAGRKPAKKAAAKSKAAKGKAAKGKKAQAGAATAGTAKKARAKEPEAKPVKNLKGHTKKLIAKQFSEIMESMAERSKAGSLAHAKFLFEIGGVKEDLARVRRGKAEPTIAELLMGGIKLRQEANAAELEESLRSGDESSRSQDEDDEMGEGAAD